METMKTDVSSPFSSDIDSLLGKRMQSSVADDLKPQVRQFNCLVCQSRS